MTLIFAVTNVNKPKTRSSSRAMKTRSMAYKSSATSKTPSTGKSSITSTPMGTNDNSTSQLPSCTRDLPGRVTRSRAVETKTNHPVSMVDRLAPSFQSVSMFTQASESIPNNFSFNVPDGVESFVFCGNKFKFTPLSPSSAQKFFPTCTPVKEVAKKTEQTCAVENENNNEEIVPPKEQEVDKEVMEEFTTVDTVDIKDVDEEASEEVIKDVLDTNYFRNLANNEIDRLRSRCAQWENEDDEMIPEEGEEHCGAWFATGSIDDKSVPTSRQICCKLIVKACCPQACCKLCQVCN